MTSVKLQYIQPFHKQCNIAIENFSGLPQLFSIEHIFIPFCKLYTAIDL